MALVASPSSPISQKEQIELADLCDYPLILGPETSATRQIILEKLKAEGFDTSSLIAVEVGISFYYMKNVVKEVSEGRLKILHLVDDIQVGVEVLVRRDVSLSPITNKFIALARETFSVPNEVFPTGEATPLSN